MVACGEAIGIEMKRLSFPTRLVLALLVPVGVTLASARILGTSTASLLMGAGLGGVSAWCVALWMERDVRRMLGRVTRSMRALEDALETGGRVPALDRLESNDEFGHLTIGLNRLIDRAHVLVSQFRSENQDLRQQRARFEGILGTMVEGVLVLDADGRVIYSNRTALRLIDSENRDLDGRVFSEIVRSPELQSELETALATGDSFRKEFTLNRTKSVVEISATRFPLTPHPGIVLVLHNVTELRRLERMRREFVSNVSHELKTPLTAIQAYADTLVEGALDDPENSRLFASRITEQAGRLQELIQDMLRLARIESQSEAFQVQLVNLSDVIAQCVEARRPIAQARHLRLQMISAEAPVEVQADPEGVRTIVDNLLANALNYTPDGGQVDVRWIQESGTAVIEVEDNGIGIRGEDRERIFERFFRTDKARGRGMGGTGLGLAIVKHLAIVFSGTVEVESEVGRGSLFRVVLPIAREPSTLDSSLQLDPSS